MALTKRTFEVRARKGAALLDEKRPGWWRTVRIRDLDMSSGQQCILGQAFQHALVPPDSRYVENDDEGYSKGMELLFPNYLDSDAAEGRQAVLHGFNVDDDIHSTRFADGHSLWDVLATAWASQVRERRRAYRAELAERKAAA